MACGNPPDPDHMTPPEDVRQPILQPASLGLREIQDAVRHARGGKELDALMNRASRLVARAGGQQLREQFQRLEQEAEARARQLAAGITTPRSSNARSPAESVENISAARSAPFVRDALDNPKHFMHDKMSSRLIEYVRGNQQIGSAYRNQLPKDIAEVLRVTPNALGLVNRAYYRGQKQPLASQSKLGRGTGYVYEIMGTAALIRQTSQPANKGGRPLSIQPGVDRVDHGIKLQGRYFDDRRELYQSRKTIEADIIIKRPGTADIAVDFKHAKDGGSVSDKDGREATKRGESALATQLFGIKGALQTGEIEEFHFATNGRFSDAFRDAVSNTNRELAQSGDAPISLHEHVIAANLRAS